MKQIALEKTTSEFIKEFLIESKKYEESSLIEDLRKITSYKPLSSEKLKKDEVIRGIVDEWFSQRIRRKYKRFSSEIFKLQREMEINEKQFSGYFGGSRYFDKSCKEIKIKIPMLAEAELDKQTEWKAEFFNDNGELKGKFTYNDIQYENTYQPSLFSRVPKVPLDVREAGKKALVFVYRIYAEAFDTEILDDVLMGNPNYVPYTSYNYVPLKPELLVLWKPKPSEIHTEPECLDDDSALVLKHDYKYYLVKIWNETYKEPLKDIVSACESIILKTA